MSFLRRMRRAASDPAIASLVTEATSLRAQLQQARYDHAAAVRRHDKLADYTRAVERERDALRDDLVRQVKAAQCGPLGDTAPMPRVRSHPAPGPQWFEAGELVTPWRPGGTDTPAGL